MRGPAPTRYSGAWSSVLARNELSRELVACTMLHPLTLALLLFSAQGSPLRLDLDEPILGRLVPGAPDSGSAAMSDANPLYEIAAASERDVVISLVSCDFDPRFSVTTDASGTIEVDGGGCDSNALARLTQRAGERLRIRIDASDGGQGDFEICAFQAAAVAAQENQAVVLAAGAYERAALRALEAGEHARAAARFERQGGVLERHGPLPVARTAYRRMLAAAKNAGLVEDVIRARTHVAGLDLLLDDETAVLEEIACLEEETRSGTPDALRAGVLQLRGLAALKTGDVEVAIASHDEELLRARTAGSARLECRALLALAGARARNGQASSAERLLQRALELSKECGDDALRAEVWLRYGQHEEARGENRKAYEHLQRALELRPDLMTRINVLGMMGNALFDLDEPLKARRCFEESLELSEAAGLRSYSPKYLIAFGNLEISRGSLDVAVALLERARDASPDRRHALDRAEALLSLAQARRLRGGPDDERAASEEAEEILGLGRELDDLRLQVGAVILLTDGGPASDPAPAELRRVLEELAERAASSPQVEVAAMALAKLAWDDCLRGRFADAVRNANLACERFGTLGEEEQCLFALDTVALAALRASDEDELAVAVDRMGRILDREGRIAAYENRSVPSLRYLAMLEPYEHDLLALRIRARGSSVEAAQRLVEAGFERTGRWKGRSLLDSLIRRRTTSAPRDEAWLAARLAWSDAGRRCRALAHHRAPPAEVEEAYFAAAAHLRRLEEIERDAREQAGEGYPRLEPRGASASAVQSLLSDDRVALIEFVAGTQELYGYLLTDKRLEFVTLGPRAPIERDARAFVRLLATNTLPGDAPRGTSLGLEGIVQLGNSLYADLLTRALDSLGPSIERLVILPTAELSDLPFEALIEPLTEPQDRPLRFGDLPFVVKRHAVTYAPSSAALFEIAASSPRARTPTVLVLADPDYESGRSAGGALLADVGGRAGTSDPAHDGLEPLRHTRSEAADIVSMIAGWTQPPRAEDAVAIQEIRSGRRDAHRSVDGFELYLGREATVERLRSCAGRFSIIHVGAHGLKEGPGTPEPSFVLTRGASENGIVTCRDVLELQLDADLVVLAVCHSAERRTIDGEGIHSLARAFLHAGARGVIGNLWEARDLESGELMKMFYTQHLKAGVHPAQALRRAKLAALDGAASRGLAPRTGEPQARFTDVSDPYFWAGFVYCGLPK